VPRFPLLRGGRIHLEPSRLRGILGSLIRSLGMRGTVRRTLVARGEFLHHRILKVPDHGNKWNLDAGILQHLRPEAAVVSHGNGRFGRTHDTHPHREVMKLLARSAAEVLSTHPVTMTGRTIRQRATGNHRRQVVVAEPTWAGQGVSGSSARRDRMARPTLPAVGLGPEGVAPVARRPITQRRSRDRVCRGGGPQTQPPLRAVTRLEGNRHRPGKCPRQRSSSSPATAVDRQRL
jgi:hypothetical protein